MYRAEIVLSSYNGWDVRKAVSLRFKNRLKCEYFASYYSLKNNVLVKLFEGGWWYASFVGGKEIWNDF